jgi:uncharacterized protein YceH (UPF0502 family)
MENASRPLSASTASESDTVIESDTASTSGPSPVRRLTRAQRRVLGVLIEKGLTTPEYYPLTRKAVTTGCNQKNNRSPLTNYSEDTVEETLDELRQLGLVAVVHTESGRTERYRHFMRQRYPFSETQLAVVTELLLRGPQQLGELRSRASRMVPIDSLEQLRSDLQELAAQGYVRSGGPLDRRGIEVDHTFYETGEKAGFDRDTSAMAHEDEDESHEVETSARPAAATAGGRSSAGEAQVAALEREFSAIRAELQETREEVEALKEALSRLNDELADLRRELGG